MPGRMIMELFNIIIFWFNALPPSLSVRGELISRQILTGLTINYINHCRLQFGDYEQVHTFHDNTIQERATGAIAMRPTRNSQGEYFFTSLATGR